MLSSKENVVTMLLTPSKISLSQIDYRFLSNVQKQIEDGTGITSNQAALFDKLLRKYTRQLKKNQIDSEQAIVLPWKARVLPSTEEYTGAKVWLTADDVLVFKVPFNNKFIQAFNKDRSSGFVYEKSTKTYQATFSTKTFKYVATRLDAFFDKISFSPELSNILEELKSYKNCIFDPTLIEAKGNLVVVACNEILSNIIKDIKLEKTPACFERMLSLGIKIHEDLMTDPILKFAGKFRGTIEQDNFTQVVKWLQDLGYTGYIIPRAASNMKLAKELILALEEVSIKPISLKGPGIKFNHNTDDNGKIAIFVHSAGFDFTTYIKNLGCNTIAKTLVIKDSTNIEVK